MLADAGHAKVRTIPMFQDEIGVDRQTVCIRSCVTGLNLEEWFRLTEIRGVPE